MQLISMKQAASLLEVSEATVRNWVTHGYISTALNTKSKFEETAVLLLRQKIESGEINRLRKRANKKITENSFIPDEYVYDENFITEIEKIRSIFSTQSLNVAVSLYVLTVKLLQEREELALNGADIFKPHEFNWYRRDSVRNELIAWVPELNINETFSRIDYLKLFDALTNTTHDDTIGILYQSLLAEGNKSKQGSYYTPVELIDGIFKSFEKKGAFLDPCCGTGQFLIRATKFGYTDPDLIHGFDIDPIAIRIARINILLALPDVCFSPKIYHANTLTEVATGDLCCETNHLKGYFQLIATNPPWGADLSDPAYSSISTLYPQISSGESFSYFLGKSLDLLAPGGGLSFILPESLLNIRVHSDIRNLILSKTSVSKIHSCGRKFKGVFTPVVRLDLLNTPAPSRWSVKLISIDSKENEVPQARFQHNLHQIFDAGLSEEENQIISLLYSRPYVSLKNNAEWALGIVTGNNEKFVSPSFQQGMEPIFKGSDIKLYQLKEPTSFIKFTPENFQQVAPEAKYRAKEKLIYKFISNRLVFAFDEKQSLTLNSANILIPRLEGYSIKVILSLLNSSLFNFVFIKKFNTHKVLRGDLENLPFPIFTPKECQSLERLVEQGIHGANVFSAIDDEIFRALGLTKSQIDVVMRALK